MIEFYRQHAAVEAAVNLTMIIAVMAAITVVVMGPERPHRRILKHPWFGSWTVHTPNLLSIVRFPLALWIMVAHAMPELQSKIAFITLHMGFWICCLCDILDGKFARKWQAITEDGKSLDPAADKFVTFSLAFSAHLFGELPSWALVIVIAREVISMIQRGFMRRRGQDVSAGWLGKVKTGVQFTVLYILILRMPDLPGTIGLELIARAFPAGLVQWSIVLLCFITVISLFPFFETFWYVNKYRRSQREECNRPWYIVAVPNLFTIGNYLCGVTAVYFAMPQVEVLYRPFVILFWVMAGAFLDALDGPLARRLKVHSEFGSCLDSSTDLSTFGLSVATIIFLVFSAMPAMPLIVSLAVSGFYFAMVHLRLARFVQQHDEQTDSSVKDDFIGLPSPSGAFGVLVFLTLFHDLRNMSPFEVTTLTLLIVGTSLLMYSEYDYISHANAVRHWFYRWFMIPTVLTGFGMLLILNFQQPFVDKHFSHELIYYFRVCSWILAAALAIYMLDGVRRGKAAA